MGFWSLIKPEPTTNLVTNPSIEIDTTGFTAVGSAIARETGQQKRGVASLKVTPTSSVNDGVYFGTIALTNGQSYTFSLDFKGTDGEAYTIYFANTSGTEQGTSTDFTATGEWERQQVTWACDSTASYRIYITKNNDNNTDPFYVDGVQVENLAYATTYIDGSLGGGSWAGAEHGSTSSRDALHRAGGKVINLDDYGFYVEQMPGIGVPPIQHNFLSTPLLPGASYRSRKTNPRYFTLAAFQFGDTHEDLHSKRKDLWDAIKPDLVTDDQPIMLGYTGANSEKPVWIQCRYDSGYQWGATQGFAERDLPIRLISYDDPFWREVGNAAAQLTTVNTFGSHFLVKKDPDSSWGTLGIDADYGTDVEGIVEDDDYIYICGWFTGWDGVTNADGVARYNKSTGNWEAMGTGTTTACYAICKDQDNNIYVGGGFTSMGGVSNTSRIAKWNGSTWEAMGTGINGNVWVVAMAPDGNIYAGGNFSDAGGVTAYKLAIWDGSSWADYAGANINSGGVAVNSLVWDSDGNLYVGGGFPDIGSDSSLGYLAKHDGATWYAVGSIDNAIIDQVVLSLAIDAAGNLYAGGNFSASGNSTMEYIGMFNGRSWVDIGDGGFDDQVNFVGLDASGDLIALGEFTAIGDLEITDRSAVYNGSSWAHLDFNLPGASGINMYHQARDGSIFVLSNCTGATTNASYPNTITNEGTTEAYPIIKIARSGGTSAVMKWLRNATTDATLYIDYSLLDGEELTIDLTPGRKSVSSNIFGTKMGAVLRGSDFAKFSLYPGENIIEVFVDPVGSPTITGTIEWVNTHWAADGVAP